MSHKPTNAELLKQARLWISQWSPSARNADYFLLIGLCDALEAADGRVAALEADKATQAWGQPRLDRKERERELRDEPLAPREN